MKKKNKNYTPLWASNHVLADSEVNDYYATDPKAMRMFNCWLYDKSAFEYEVKLTTE